MSEIEHPIKIGKHIKFDSMGCCGFKKDTTATGVVRRHAIRDGQYFYILIGGRVIHQDKIVEVC